MKTLGVEWILAVSAVGSLKKEIEPGHVVVPDQLIDRTFHRASTFIGRGIVAHVGFADPYCRNLGLRIAEAARGAGATVHEGGTYVCMEGPLFSTGAESNLYRSWGASVIGMTSPPGGSSRARPRCRHARASTDYDGWNGAPRRTSTSRRCSR